MSVSRLAGIPMDHVVAELAAFPIATEASFRLGLTHLDPMFAPATDATPSCQPLWREAERHVLGSFPAYSVDEAVAIRDAVWFAGGQEAPVPLHRYLRQLAESFLEVRGDVAFPRLPTEHRRTRPAESSHEVLARERWRWMALALPPDLLLAFLGSPGHGPDRVELLSPSLEIHLRDHPYAETHLHLGAGFDFPLLWATALRVLAYPDLLKVDHFKSPGASLDEGRSLCPWLIRAAMIRYLLAHFLFRGHWDSGFQDHLDIMARDGLIPPLGGSDFALLRTGFTEIRSGTLSEGAEEVHADWRSLYAQITRITAETQLLDLYSAAANADPIGSLLAPGGRGRWSAEMQFVAQAYAYLTYAETTPPPRDSALFAQLFWQVTRVRVLIYRHMVQRPMTPGLQWFVRFYDRLWPASQLLTRALQLRRAADLGGAGRGLRSLEVRLAPLGSNTRLLEVIEHMDDVAQTWCDGSAAAEAGLVPASAATGTNPLSLPGPVDRRAGQTRPSWEPTLELGVVFHFIKLRGGHASEGVPKAHWNDSNADPGGHGNHRNISPNPTCYRYAQFYRQRWDDARRLAWLFENFPHSLEIVRGLDVCTDEIGVPTWVLIPVLAHVREAAEAASASISTAVWRRHGGTVPTLRTTIHAGEDFVHLLSGLRQVDEAIEGFQMRSGDRIGHGIALGVDPRDWARRAGRLPMLREERLWDLVWEWSWYGRGGLCSEPDRQAFLDREIALLSEEVFKQSIPPYQLETLGDDLRRLCALQEVGFPDGLHAETPDPDSRSGRLYRYLSDRLLFRRGREFVWVDTRAEAEVLACLQAGLRQKVGALGLTVEVNPTSNLLIGNLGDLTVHPLWRLRPPRPGDGPPPVSVCIGSDDPLVFGSHLRQEYQALCDAMVLAGLSDEEARQWLDRTRASGMESRFTLSRRSGLPIFPPRL